MTDKQTVYSIHTRNKAIKSENIHYIVRVQHSIILQFSFVFESTVTPMINEYADADVINMQKISQYKLNTRQCYVSMCHRSQLVLHTVSMRK